ncbi:MAG: Fur family transcriptional regulator [Actinomycetota bacterium]
MELDAVLRAGDFRVTRPRRLVWEVLTGEHGHLSAQEIAEQVRAIDPTVNQSSVYRTLGLFAELELVRESKLGGGDTSHWEPIHDDAVIHLVCEHCGEVIHHVADGVEQLRHRVLGQERFEARSIEVVVRGRCERCGARMR